MALSPVRVERTESGDTCWESAVAALTPALRPHVPRCVGYAERATGPVVRRELPGPHVVVILELAAPVRVHDPVTEDQTQSFVGGFVAGLDDRSTLTSHAGQQSGIELALTPSAARHFFGRPASELAGQVLPLRELLPREHRNLAERLAELSSWEARLGVVHELLGERLAAAAPEARVAAWAEGRIRQSGGSLDMKTLAAQLGYSPKHVITLFREHVGMTPKRFARLVRFDRLVQHLRAAGQGSWAELAQRFGWYDQAHLSHDVKQIVGLPPARARELLCGPGVNFLQDRPDPES